MALGYLVQEKMFLVKNRADFQHQTLKYTHWFSVTSIWVIALQSIMWYMVFQSSPFKPHKVFPFKWLHG